MRRREALALLLALGLAPARAQASRRVGVLLAGSSASADSRRQLRAFTEGMAALGYEERRDVAFDVRYYGNDRNRIAVLADGLLFAGAQLIVANVARTASIVRERTRSVPIVVASGLDPVGEGLALSLEQPGGNVTGLTSLSPDMHEALIALLTEIVPGAKRVAFLVNPGHPRAGRYEQAAREAAVRRGAELVTFPLSRAADFAALEERLSEASPQALVVSADVQLFNLREGIVRAANRAGVPTFGVLAQFATRGAVAALGPDLAENFREAARYVDRILKGAKPGELPMEGPRQFELVVNQRAAKAFKLALPREVLLRADRVIE